MMAQAGASFHEAVDWSSIDWTSVFRNVRRLQARIVKAINIAVSQTGHLKGLSRLRRKAHGRFLGGLGLATASGYPTAIGRQVDHPTRRRSVSHTAQRDAPGIERPYSGRSTAKNPAPEKSSEREMATMRR